MPPERKPSISLPRNQFIALVIGVCVLSAAIGSGLALLAQTGPKGAQGERGPRGHKGKPGPEGPAGESAGEELGALEGEVEELRGAVEEAQEGSESNAEVGELEESPDNLADLTLTELGHEAAARRTRGDAASVAGLVATTLAGFESAAGPACAALAPHPESEVAARVRPARSANAAWRRRGGSIRRW